MLLGVSWRRAPILVPGVILAMALVASSIMLANLANRALGVEGLISYIMIAVLLGLAVRNALGVPEVCKPGISFCLRKLLRLGIIMMGIRLSVFDAARIGVWGIPIVLVCIAVGLLVSTFFTRLFRLPGRLGILISVGTGICGASAIVATAPAIEARDEEVAYAVANITVFGILAMLIYPYVAYYIFGGNTIMAGLFQGTSIHETAQVAGAGLIYDQTFNHGARPSAGDIAVVTKLLRNIFMVAVIPLMAFVYGRRASARGELDATKVSIVSLFPLFILGFLGMAGLRSIGDAGVGSGVGAFALWDAPLWKGITGMVADWAGYILAAAMAGVGLGTSFEAMKGLGIKPFYVGFLSAAAVGLASIALVMALGSHIRF